MEGIDDVFTVLQGNEPSLLGLDFNVGAVELFNGKGVRIVEDPFIVGIYPVDDQIHLGIAKPVFAAVLLELLLIDGKGLPDERAIDFWKIGKDFGHNTSWVLE